jgi:acetoin utilization protein AcuB
MTQHGNRHDISLPSITSPKGQFALNYARYAKAINNPEVAMLVRERMSQTPSTCTPDTSVTEALRLMKERKVRRLPVLDSHNKLVGIASEKDLLYASPSPVSSLSVWEMNYLLAKLKVEEVMTRRVITVTEDTPLEDAARSMVDNKIGGLPVMRGETMVGIVTETDLFKTFLELLGARQPGVRVTALVSGAKGTLAKITNAIFGAGGDIVAFTQSRDATQTRWEVTAKVEDVSKDKLVEALKPVVQVILDVREE